MKKRQPKYTYFRKGRWVYIPFVDGVRCKEISLKHDGKLIRDCDPMSWVWDSFEKIMGQPSDSLKWLISKYLKSPTYEELTPRTKESYDASAEYLSHKLLKNGEVFGDVSFEAITPGTVTKLADSMKETPTLGKHRIQFLSAVYTWAVARDISSKNPCKAAVLPRNTKKKSKKYVEDFSFDIALNEAQRLDSYIYPMMIIAYCCRARVGEISRHQRVKGQALLSGIRKKDISKEGIFINRSKGSLPEVTLWAEFLEEGYNAAIKYSKKQDIRSNITRIDPNPFLIRSVSGKPINKNAFESSWQRMIKTCSKIDGFKPFTIHELKAKGIDDHKNQASGHKTESAKAVYLRKVKRTESTK